MSLKSIASAAFHPHHNPLCNLCQPKVFTAPAKCTRKLLRSTRRLIGKLVARKVKDYTSSSSSAHRLSKFHRTCLQFQLLWYYDDVRSIYIYNHPHRYRVCQLYLIIMPWNDCHLFSLEYFQTRKVSLNLELEFSSFF